MGDVINMTILDGKALSEKILAELAERVKKLPRAPRLAAVLVGADPASVAFLNLKKRACQHIGAEYRHYVYPVSVSGQELSRELNQIVREGRADGLIVQLPLPEHLDENRHAILRVIPEELDIDCLTEQAHGRLASGRTQLQFRHGNAEYLAPFGKTLHAFFSEYGIELAGKHAVVVGWGELIGKIAVPVLLRARATVSVCRSSTPDLVQFTRNADIIVSGTGKPGLIRGDMVKEGVVVIDAGSTMVEGKQRGDVDFDSVQPKASFITPVPGGVGPMVVAMLLDNLVSFAEAKHGIEDKK